MSHPRAKQPLDVLQSMVNAILLETGRALRATDKQGARTLANSNVRLRTTIPSAIDNFHQALDDLESDIVRAKAVLLRDLGELRSKRLALENPPPPIEEPVEEPLILEPDLPFENGMVDDNQPTPQLDIKDEEQSLGTPEAKATPQDPSKETIPKIPDLAKGIQGPTPPSSEETKPNAVNLGIDTSIAAANGTPPPGTAGGQESAVDSLFGNLDSANDNSGGDLNLDGMEFLNDTSAHDSQAQNNDFDLDAFGNNAGDYNMTDLHETNDAANTNVGDVGTGAQDDLFATGNNDAAEMMDLDLNSLRPAEESLFEDMYFMGDDGGLGGAADMELDDFFGPS